MGKQRKKINIERAIVLGDAKRIEEGVFPFRTLNCLSEKVAEKLFISKRSAYMKLYRADSDGFVNKDDDLINAVCELLRLKEEEIIFNFE